MKCESASNKINIHTRSKRGHIFPIFIFFYNRVSFFLWIYNVDALILIDSFNINEMISSSKKGFLFAFLSSILFSLSTPLSKLLLEDVQPLVLSALYYLISGFFFIPSFWMDRKYEKIKLTDVKKISLMGISGAILAPIFLLYGIQAVSAFESSLFLNFELIFTLLIAFLVYKDKIGKKGIMGMIVVLSSLILWSIEFQITKFFSNSFSIGAFLIILACLCWGVDNNVSRSLGDKSSLQITSIKGVFGGTFNFVLLIILKVNFSITWSQFVLIFIVGLLSYGVSIVCFLSSLKSLGTIKSALIFSLSPFFSAIISFLTFGNLIDLVDWGVFLVVLVGIILILIDQHIHQHSHLPITHIHPIDDDNHHQNSQIREIRFLSGCVFEHTHFPFLHSHKHNHDLHHHHSHHHNP